MADFCSSRTNRINIHSRYKFYFVDWKWHFFITFFLIFHLFLYDSVTANSPPRFIIDGQTEIVLRFKEGKDTPVGSLLYRLRGTDPDGDPLTFGVREQIGNEILRIENLGSNEANLYLKKELDREVRDEYALVLTLTDGHLGDGTFITQSLLLLVEDVNDNEPIFKPYQTSISVPEDSGPGVLTTVEATDLDEGPYGQVVYHLQELDGENDLFSVSTINGKGVIRLVGQLDYERKFLYQLRVLAVDRSNNDRINTATAAILIKVQDVEDQPPEFVVASPVTRVSEDAAVGTTVLQVRALDGDRGVNNRIMYTIARGSKDTFDIDPTTGAVFTLKNLDRESPLSSNGAYILEIMAKEESRTIFPPPTARTEVTIIVTDVNDEKPTFRSTHYNCEINENAQANTPVTFLGPVQPQVFDYDLGNNGTFEMFIDDDNGIFDVTPRHGINEATFLIRVKDPAQLDYEDIPVDMKYIADPSMHSMPAVTLSPNQKWLACQSMDNKIVIFSALNRFKLNRKKTFSGHMVAGYACSLDFSPDMSYIVSGDADGKCYVWDWKTTKLFKKWKAHENVCIGALWHPHEPSKVVTAGWDGLIKYWD